MTGYRCTACGNRTRFDVVETTTAASFHHYSLGGTLDVEDTKVLASTVQSVTCRWCGHGRDVVAIDSDPPVR